MAIALRVSEFESAQQSVRIVMTKNFFINQRGGNTNMNQVILPANSNKKKQKTRSEKTPQSQPLYPSANQPFDLALFQHPSAEYRGAPFWSWNTRLQADVLEQQIHVFKRMGMGGFHIHPRTGLNTKYLGEEFMDLVDMSVKTAESLDLRVWLYDEDRWPSGFAGGLVTQDKQFRAHHLLFTQTPYNGTVAAASLISNANARRFENGTLLARYQIHLEHGRLVQYKRLRADEPVPTTGIVWYAYLERSEPSPWWNNQTYVDTLNPAATARFIEITHERYKAVVGNHFGKTIPAIFTDEPQFTHKVLPRRADDSSDLFLPWTPDFASSYAQVHNHDLLETLPEIFWERADKAASVHRYQYHDHLAERFASAYADTLGQWCETNGLMLTGHMMEEPTLESQTAALGEAMRSYRAFHLPGIDMLCDWREYTTAKQAQSAARQYGRPGVLSELYGVTNWDFDFRGHKAQGDWQAALGVTVRVHHLTWVSMAGEAKRDYPASIGYQSPWYLEYPLIEDHFARVNTAMTRGKPLVRVGVIHPIESFWLCYGALEQTSVEREDREMQFQNLTEWLLFGLIDFDFVAESLLPDLCPNPNTNPLEVGAARYDVIVVPNLKTIRQSTLERLEAFHQAGGTVIFLGQPPSLIDAMPSTRPSDLASLTSPIPFVRGRLLETLNPWREVSITLAGGRHADSILHQIRVDGDERFVFFCNTDVDHPRSACCIRLQGHWQVMHLETMTGTTHPLPSRIESDETVINWDFSAHGHLLLHLETRPHQPSPNNGTEAPEQSEWLEVARLSSPQPVTLSEPNVMLLDRAEYRLNDEPWQAISEVLRVDNLLRKRLGFPLKMDALAQPWTVSTPPEPTHSVSLRFSIESQVRVEDVQLALEDANSAELWLDGIRLENTANGFWVDESIQTLPLPVLEVGTHLLEIRRPYDAMTNLEWCYLLGDFGVEVHGARARLTAPIRELHWGDWTRQGLPFYAGNVTYHATLEQADHTLTVEVAHFNTPLMSVKLDGQPLGKIAFAPYRLELHNAVAGTRHLEITAFGNRVNAFGAIHNADNNTVWFGPDAWRSEDDRWSEEYQLKPMGVLVAPRLLTRVQ